MASILHLVQNMEEELPGADATVPSRHASPISAFVDPRRGSHGGRGNYKRGSCGGRGLPNECNGCGNLDHILSSCTASYDALLKWTLAKRKLIVHKYGTRNVISPAHAALLSDLFPADTSPHP
jgi:hypothetical protein